MPAMGYLEGVFLGGKLGTRAEKQPLDEQV
jgi:hypothetical protein